MGGAEYVFSFLLDGVCTMETNEWNLLRFRFLIFQAHVLSYGISADDDGVAVICFALYDYHRTQNCKTESRIYNSGYHLNLFP